MNVKSKFLSLSKLRNFSSSPKFFLILSLVLVVFRYIIGLNQRYWASPSSSGTLDDELLFRYANLPNHFHSYDLFSLVKTIGYPIFLAINKATGLPYGFTLTSLYLMAAVLVFFVIRNITESRVVQFLSFSFVLFIPSAFESWIGARVYRNAIIAPVGIITLSLLILFVMSYLKKMPLKSRVMRGITLGISLTFAYFIKESGFYWLPIALLAVLCVLVMSIKNSLVHFVGETMKKKVLKIFVSVLVSLLPLLILFGSMNLYKAVNYHYFGVYEIETRTSGEVGKFVQNIYKIKSDNRNDHIWAPFDAIEKAFDTSPTLQQYPDLLYDIEHNTFFEDGDPIKGDFLGWVLRFSMAKEGIWTNEKEVSDMFAIVNSELKSGFDSGKLEKESRIQITSSAGGFSLHEILHLTKPVLGILDDNIRYGNYVINKDEIQYDDHDLRIYETITNTPGKAIDINLFTRISDSIIGLYRTIGSVIFILAFIGLIGLLISICRKKMKSSIEEVLSLFSMIALLGTALIVAIGTAWFCAFLDMGAYVNHFYGVDVLPFMVMFELIGCTWFCKYSSKIVKKLSFLSPTALRRHDDL
jgi:hypothetical protein